MNNRFAKAFFIIVGIFVCLFFIAIGADERNGDKFYDALSRTDQLDLPNAEKSFVNIEGGESVKDVYYQGMQALKMKDYSKAETLIRRAALAGDSAAQFSLAKLYENGFGVPKDGIQACYWYRTSEHNKNTDAQKALNRLIEKNKAEPITWEMENC
jgi:hypothetical protein